jgi:hypothetical protein
MQGYIQHFKRGNPVLLAKLVENLSVCSDEPPATLKATKAPKRAKAPKRRK